MRVRVREAVGHPAPHAQADPLPCGDGTVIQEHAGVEREGKAPADGDVAQDSVARALGAVLGRPRLRLVLVLLREPPLERLGIEEQRQHLPVLQPRREEAEEGGDAERCAAQPRGQLELHGEPPREALGWRLNGRGRRRRVGRRGLHCGFPRRSRSSRGRRPRRRRAGLRRWTAGEVRPRCAFSRRAKGPLVFERRMGGRFFFPLLHLFGGNAPSR